MSPKYQILRPKYLLGCCVLFFSFGFFSVPLIAQQDWSYSQYLFNLYDINAAYAGNHQTMSFALRHRSQWIGMEGAPVTQQFSMHTPLMNDKLGAGIRLMNEKIGARSQQFVKVSGAYKLRFGERTLSFGLAGGVIRQSIDRTKITAADNQDNQLNNLAASTITPVLDVSVFYNTKKYYFGIESGRINRSNYNYAEGSLARLYYNVAIVGGYMKQIKENSMLQFSGLVKMSEGRIWQAELNLLYLHNNKFWVGAGYRYMCGFQTLACVNVSEHFRLGLSYDMSSGKLRKMNDGSAELFLGYTLKNRSGKSVRYF